MHYLNLVPLLPLSAYTHTLIWDVLVRIRVQADLRDRAVVDSIMAATAFDAVIHFAALKAVGESTAKPLEYYDNNLGSLLNVLFAMRKHGVNKIGAATQTLHVKNTCSGKATSWLLTNVKEAHAMQ